MWLRSERFIFKGATSTVDSTGKWVEFPSHHVGYITPPQTFAQRLREVLSE